MQTRVYAAQAAKQPLVPSTIERREVGADDVAIDILFSGICHSDIHQAREEWGKAIFPMVPGHEIVGRVSKVGANVTKVKVGDLAGVGCMVDSCRACSYCREDHEQFCDKGNAATYNGTEMDRKTPTYGGYAQHIVVTERFVLKVPGNLDPAGAAPLLCAGITTYSPLKQWQCRAGSRVGVVGLGGLGHMAVKIAAAMGAEVTMLSTSQKKAADAKKLGAHDFVLTSDKDAFKKLAKHFDLLIDTVSASHDYNAYLRLLRPYGAMVCVGAPPEPQAIAAFALIGGNKRLAGSMIGGIRETQEMLDFCADKNIVADVEVIAARQINEAYERTIKGDVRYRFSIDARTFAE
ncbi:MAG TPA: NAD(P)-dependent alcohol dehydrogenase [Kofleriaceae bacterium]|nr:NAD(P)-dependent alcohol dehydrogenase [Kofleriaceae bacterium]